MNARNQTEGDTRPGSDLCLLDCYWECEHRAASSPGIAASPLQPVHDESGRALNRCRECGDLFYSVMDHSRDHARKRQMGWLPERLPDTWPTSPSPRRPARGPAGASLTPPAAPSGRVHPGGS